MAVTQVDMSTHIGARHSISETADIVGFSHITIFMDNTELQKVKSSHQVDKVLITDLSISIAISKGQQDFQFVGVELRAMGGQQVPEPLCTDEA